MKCVYSRFRLGAVAAAIALALPLNAAADATYDALKLQIEMLQKQLQQIEETLKQQEEKTATKEEVQEVKQDVATVSEQQSEWKNTESVVHLAGYGDVSYTDRKGDPGAFSTARINPIFHFQYKDLIMLGAELEIEVEDDGSTSSSLEYTTIDIFVNDYLALGGGKFLSPLGQFRQNIHPSWINKLPTAPAGFGHDQAAPNAEMGMQARGGFPVGKYHMNYAAFVGNGPVLEFDGDELEAVEANGRSSNDDDELVYGGRLALVPLANSEVGVSLATGQVSDVDNKNDTRDYDVFGADFGYKWNNLGLRGEYIKQKVGSNSNSAKNGSTAEWEAWYAQAAYRFMPTKFEAVIRYADYDANLNDGDQKQWGLGINYVLAANAMVKFGYNVNDGESGTKADDNEFQIQIAYGF